MRHIVGSREDGTPTLAKTLCGLEGRDASSVDRITIDGVEESGSELELCDDCNRERVQRALASRDGQFRDADAGKVNANGGLFSVLWEGAPICTTYGTVDMLVADHKAKHDGHSEDLVTTSVLLRKWAIDAAIGDCESFGAATQIFVVNRAGNLEGICEVADCEAYTKLTGFSL